MTAFNFNAIADEVASTQADANVAKAGGGSYTPPPKGLARLRLVGYIELGKHEKPARNGNPTKVEDQAWLIFELSGKGYEPKVLDDGTKIPMRITVKLNKSLNEKATYYKLFKRMNYEQKATSFIQLLGQAYLGNVGHFEIPGKDGAPPTIIANFRDDSGNLTIRPPRVETMDDETGDVVTRAVPVPEPVSEQRCLVWDSKPEHLAMMWQSLYIPDDNTEDNGEDTEKRSRNVYQDMIRKALNFEGSPIQQYLQSQGVDLGIPPAEDAKGTKGATQADPEDDPLNMVG